MHQFGVIMRKALQLLVNCFDKMTIDVGFCIESREDDEMPEILFGGGEVYKPSLEKAEQWN